jgi:ABC-type multidrug transport system ATPase subunit
MPPDADTAIHLEGLRKVYRTRKGGRRVALDGVDLSARRGTWTALLGPNGSGKSTLLGILATALAPDGGSARVLGFDPAREAVEIRRRLGVVFQSAALDDLLTARENLALQGSLVGLGGAESRARGASLAEALGFADRLGDRVGSLSGGLRRRVDLARALMGGPALVLLDEPETGLDLASRSGLLDLIAERRSMAPGATIVMTTHLMASAERADRVVMLSGGRVVADGEPGGLRRGLNERVIHAAPGEAGALRSAGLEVREVAGEAVGSGDASSMERAAAGLARSGAWFRVQPPTLGDVYLSLAGRPLEDEAGG